MDLGELKIAVEDRFIILQLNVDRNLLPSGDTLSRLAYILRSFSSQYQIVCDFRNVKNITYDLLEFIEEFESYGCQVLLDQNNIEYFQEHVNSNISLLPVNKYETRFDEHPIDLTIFADDHSIDLNYKKYHDLFEVLTEKFKGLPTREEYNLWNDRYGFNGLENKPYYKNFTEYLSFCKMSGSGIHIGADVIIGRRFLSDFFLSIGKKSLLSQLCLSPDKNEKFNVDVFSSHSINKIEVENKLIQAKPYVLSSKTQILHKDSLRKFQALINTENIKERQIQKFLEENPVFLESLGYKSIRPQIILERDDGTSLRPDFLLEPIGGEWWDILDIKLPTQKITKVSHKDRYSFSAGIHELQAQLREYAAYFENEKYAKRIENKYGIKCYKPKMIGVIGNEFDGTDERQLRRLITSYSDLDIIPFQQLYKICKERLPI